MCLWVVPKKINQSSEEARPQDGWKSMKPVDGIVGDRIAWKYRLTSRFL